MALRRMLAVAALLATALSAHAEHFQYSVALSGTYSIGGTDGYSPPFDQPACPRTGTLSAVMSFDTPIDGDGSWMIQPGATDITDFRVDLGWFDTDVLVGSIAVTDGRPQGSVQALDDSEYFTFDWATRTAEFRYDYGYHNPNGDFTGILSASAAPEPSATLMMLTAMVALFGAARLRHRPRSRRP